MKKKITTAMLIAAMSMSIMACGGTSKETTAPTEAQTTTTESIAATEASETASESETPAEAGYYTIYSSQSGSDEAIVKETLEGMGVTADNTNLTLDADGTVTMMNVGEKLTGTWDDGKMTVGNTDYIYNLEGNMLTLKSGDVTFVFEKDTGDTSATDTGKDLADGNYSDMGDGTMYLSTVGGTTENDNVPVLFETSDTVLETIEIDTTGFDGSKLSYIYIDGMLNTKEQLGDSQSSISLEKDALAEGTHKVEVVQYDTNEPDGTMVTYKTASYEIQYK